MQKPADFRKRRGAEETLEAFHLGRDEIIETALAAILLQIPNAALVEQAISLRCEQIREAIFSHQGGDPSIQQTIAAGADAAANTILDKYRKSSRYSQ